MATAVLNTTHEDENLETYCLIWLDASVNESEENIQAQKQLRCSINYLITFEDDQQCLKYIQSVPNDDRIILIVSGRLGQIIVPKIVKYRQVTSIYVYCMNKQANEQWAKQFNKVKAVIVEMNELIHRIKTDQHQRKQNKIDESLPLCIINAKDVDYDQSTTELNGQYLHSELLIECLINMKPNANDRKELISLCKRRYQDNPAELKVVEEFEQEYTAERAVWWYTRDSFVYQMLNKALRVQNIDLLFLFRFIIRDIEQHLEKNKCFASVRVYRAQLMSTDEVQMLKNSLGEFIVINSFFSTSLNGQKARSFFSFNDNSNDVERVFFEIEADPRLDNIKPFSDISSFSYYSEEKEVLFMIGSIFRLVNIDRDKDGILIARMKLSSNNDHHLHSLFQFMQKQPKKKPDKPSTFRYEEPDDLEDIAKCYRILGSVARKKKDYESSLSWHKKSLEIKRQIFDVDDPIIADSYNSIGHVYRETNDDVRALEWQQKALSIYIVAYGEDDLRVARCFNDIGNVYLSQHKYSKGLEMYQKALFIREKHLSTDHSDLGISHKNMGTAYCLMGQYDLALAHYNLTLKIYKKTRPSQHPLIASALRSIGLVYEHKGDFQQALSYYERAATIYRHSLSSTHPDGVQIEKDIRRVSFNLK